MTDQKTPESPQERPEGGSATLESSEGQNGPQAGAEPIDWQRRAEVAEDALDRVRHLADLIDTGAPWTSNQQTTAARIREAAASRPAGGHLYLSTGCRHGDHAYCQNHTGLSGQKTPATCKFCGAPCICGCHPPAHNAGPTVAECTAQDRAYWTDKHAEEGQ